MTDSTQYAAAFNEAQPMNSHGLSLDTADEWDECEEIICGAKGPGGDCWRTLGHTDKGLGHGNDHHSWDSDHFMHWPVAGAGGRDC